MLNIWNVRINGTKFILSQSLTDHFRLKRTERIKWWIDVKKQKNKKKKMDWGPNCQRRRELGTTSKILGYLFVRVSFSFFYALHMGCCIINKFIGDTFFTISQSFIISISSLFPEIFWSMIIKKNQNSLKLIQWKMEQRVNKNKRTYREFAGRHGPRLPQWVLSYMAI